MAKTLIDPKHIQNNEHFRVWAVSISKSGVMTQCAGVGKHFDPELQHKPVDHIGFIKRLLSEPVFKKTEKEPDIVVSCGWRAEATVAKIRRTFGKRPFTIHLQRPRSEIFDMVVVSSHRWSSDLNAFPNYHMMIGVPHQVTAERLEPLREPGRMRYAPDGKKLAAVLVGGSNGAYDYDDDSLAGLAESVKAIVAQGWRVLMTASPRSDRNTMQTILSLRGPDVEVWDFEGVNPYFDYMAAADAFLIPKDSITMPCEALSTGKPVYILDMAEVPGEKFRKFERFHDEFQNVHRLTRRFEGSLAAYAYEPLNETARIANLLRYTISRRSPQANIALQEMPQEAIIRCPAADWTTGLSKRENGK